MQGFAIILDVFSSFLIDEQKKVDEQWGVELHGVIAGIERVREATGLPDEAA
jgi:hypothetical protein